MSKFTLPHNVANPSILDFASFFCVQIHFAYYHHNVEQVYMIVVVPIQKYGRSQKNRLGVIEGTLRAGKEG